MNRIVLLVAGVLAASAPISYADKYVWKGHQTDEFINSYRNYMESLVDLSSHRLNGRFDIRDLVEEAYDEHISNPPDSQEDGVTGLLRLAACMRGMLYTGNNSKEFVLDYCPSNTAKKWAAWYENHSKEELRLRHRLDIMQEILDDRFLQKN